MKQSLIIISIFTILTACTKGFEDLNTNNNEPFRVTADLLLPTVIFNMADLLVNQTYGFNDVVAQYTANYEFNQLDIYNWTSDGRFWTVYDFLQDISDIKNYGKENDIPNYEAVGLILEAFNYSLLTDAYGDVPFTEAIRAETGIISPKYDTQQSIYSTILNNLDQANNMIDESGSISGDILYNGDMSLWKKFANSLRLRLLMRISNVQDVKAQMQQIVDNPDTYPVFTSNEEEAIYDYTGVTPNISPYSTGRGREYEYFIGVPTTHFVNLLLAHNDPRIHEWLGYKNNEDGSFEYIGVAPGQNQGDIGRPSDFSSLDTSFFENPGKIDAIFMTFSEVNFILAEAAEKGMIQADAKVLYETAVQASFNQWGVEMPAEFLEVDAPYEAGNLDRIYEQKWLALFHSGVEPWFDWKRTSKPDFIKAGPGNLNNGLVPVRIMYPSLEQSVNASNYSEAAQRIGGDNINTRIWWDKK